MISASKLAIASCFIALGTVPGAAYASESTKIGTLECFVAEGAGYVVGSSRDISCTLLSNDDEPIETYIGELTKYGVDIGFSGETIMLWSVFVPKDKTYLPGSLGGNFAGASASASLSFGLGASVLIGGLGENFALQPIRVNKQKGINIALGITRMELRAIEDTEQEPSLEGDDDTKS